MKTNRAGSVLSVHRWSKYAIASAAAASVSLTSEQSVDAQLFRRDVNVLLEDRVQGDGYFDIFGPYTFSMSGASFVFRQAYNETGQSEGILTISGYGDIAFAGRAVFPYFYVSNIPYGARISDQQFGVPGSQRGDLAWGQGYPNSQFLEPETSFVGFRFDVGHGSQYGFIELNMLGAPGNRAEFVSYTWGAPGEAVCTDNSFDPCVPEPGALGVLALGSIGLLAWRQRRAESGSEVRFGESN